MLRRLFTKATHKTQATMAWYCSGSTNAELIENLSKAGLIENERVKEAMTGVSNDECSGPQI
jgi:protein-L-isoaspartate(D-aspartate) O-methyltransferase